MVLHMLQQEPIKKTYLQAAQAALGCGHGESCHEPTAENNHAVAFFRTPGVVETLECAGDRISVGCRNGQVHYARRCSTLQGTARLCKTRQAPKRSRLSLRFRTTVLIA